MKKLIFMVTVLLLASGVNNHALADPLNTGTYMFTVTGNDPGTPTADLTNFQLAINQWFINNSIAFGPVTLEFYAKTDAFSATVTEDNNNGSTLDILYANDNKSGNYSHPLKKAQSQINNLTGFYRNFFQ
nr:hypothetical protein [uncultured Desulfobulbus sp.]